MQTKKRPRRNAARGQKDRCSHNASTFLGRGYTCLSCWRNFRGLPAGFLPLRNASASFIKRLCFLCEDCSSQLGRGGATTMAVVSAVVEAIHEIESPARPAWLTVFDGSYLEKPR